MDTGPARRCRVDDLVFSYASSLGPGPNSRADQHRHKVGFLGRGHFLRVERLRRLSFRPSLHPSAKSQAVREEATAAHLSGLLASAPAHRVNDGVRLPQQPTRSQKDGVQHPAALSQHLG